jgi:hypothetical protein
MEPEHFRFGGGASGTILHPLVAVVMVLVAILIMRLERKRMITPVLLALFLIPNGQVVVVAGVHLNVYRIILLFALARWAILRRTSAPRKLTQIDRLVTAWALSLFIIYCLQYGNTQALIKSAGDLLDALGGYYVLRFLIQDQEDIKQVIKTFALVAIVLGVCMLNEQRTGQNVFGQLGGILSAPEVRNGKIRSQGTFQHSITAGSFGATLVPLLVWLWSSDVKSRKIAVLGILGAVIMTVTGHSSTTLGCLVSGVFGLCLWPLRKNMRVIRYGIATALIGLHLVMNGPVWSLLEHIDLTGSSESYHRYQLVDTFINHFTNWCLLGTQENGSWGWEMADTSNQYVTYGVTGGLLTFVLFIAIISTCFGRLGKARKFVEGIREEEWFLWCLGSSMFAHIIVFFGIDYFDQMEFAWLSFLLMISVAVTRAYRLPVRKAKKSMAPNYGVSPAMS